MNVHHVYEDVKDNLAKHYYRIREKIGSLVARILFYSWSVLALATPYALALTFPQVIMKSWQNSDSADSSLRTFKLKKHMVLNVS